MLQLLEPVLYLYTSLVYMIYLTTINALRAVIFALVNELLYMYRTCIIQKSYMYVVIMVDSSLYREIWHFLQDKLNMTTYHPE